MRYCHKYTQVFITLHYITLHYITLHRQIFEISGVSKVMKIRPVVSDLFDADRETDRSEAGSGHFPHFCKSA